MKVCRELGGPPTNAGLAAAVMQITQRKGGSAGACFKCGKQGHLKGNVLKGEEQETANALGSWDYAPDAKRGTIGQMNVAQ